METRRLGHSLIAVLALAFLLRKTSNFVICWSHSGNMSGKQAAKEEFSEKLMVNATGQVPASEKIPQIARPFVSDRAKKTLDIVCLLEF